MMDDNLYGDSSFADCDDTSNTSQHPVDVKVCVLIYIFFFKFYIFNNMAV